MDESPVLLTIIQVSVAIAGFAGIIATFQFKGSEHLRRGNAVGLAMIVNVGLVGAFFSILPFIFFYFNFDKSLIWTLCSILMSINYTGFIIFILRHIKINKIHSLSGKVRVFGFLLIGALIVMLLILNALGRYVSGAFGPYLLSLIFPLAIVCYMFSKMLLRPLWRQIRMQESGEKE